MDNHQWFKEAGYGMMVHWGLYSLLAGEYKGRIVRPYAEWSQSFYRIPNEEYGKLTKAFNPVFFNADEWVRLAKECGMKYFVVTSKHHDGFAMYHSKVDKYNVVDATPFGRDVIAEIGEACYKHGLKLGLYYSQDLDWHEKHGGGYLSNHIRTAGTSWDNNWDFPNEDEKDFSICFENKIMPQVKEILTQYGELCLIWFDVPMTISDAQSRQIYEAIKQYQPNCLINSRLGNGAYDYVSLGDNEIPTEIPKNLGEVDANAVDGFKPSPFGLYESAATLNHTWGFSAYDQDWKSADTIFEYRTRLKKLGINYLINVGPDHLGRIPAPSVDILREVARRMGDL
ncbi:MAG: alpha-L-fucosidase [Clostridia bacterium]|nr:alpha-L-fucosidase [Clostridiales bacterium]MBQ6715375.1 alpha-L-fucosidase [Clostridia bacterium]